MKSITYRRNGATLTIPSGFSWTTLIFGIWPSVFRSHWRMMWTILALDVIAVWFTVAVFQGNDFLVAWIVLRGIAAYYRNEELNKDVHSDGWRTEADLSIVKSNGESNENF